MPSLSWNKFNLFFDFVFFWEMATEQQRELNELEDLESEETEEEKGEESEDSKTKEQIDVDELLRQKVKNLKQNRIITLKS